MEIAAVLKSLSSDYTLQSVALGTAALGFVNGVLGSFAVLRKQSLLGDAISHAALPGIALVFLLTGSKSTASLLLGAAAAGWLGTVIVMGIVGNTRIKYDSALGLTLSVFFGFGLVLLTYIQRMPVASQAGLDRFLFGQAATLLRRDLVTIAVPGAAILVLVAAFWKEFKLLSFDPDYGESLGFPARRLDILLTTLLVLAIVTGLQTVGVVLMSAMVVAPAAAARQWTDRLGAMVAISGFFGAFSGVCGVLISSGVARMPTGPTIVLALSFLVFASLMIAPKRGLLWGAAREWASRRRLMTDAVLIDLYVLSRQHEEPDHGHTIEVLRAMSLGHGGVDRSLEALRERGLARRVDSNLWAITPQGLEKARRLSGGEESEA